MALLIFCSGIHLSGQEFEWMGGFDSFLDNREYNSIGIPKTIFGSRVRGELGASLEETHRFRVGLNWLYEFGDQSGGHLPDVTMYYQYNKDHIDFRAGAFPRLNLPEYPRTDLLDYPISLLSDTLLYYRPNIEGVYLGYHGDWGYQNVFIDWTSRQTDEDFERFIFGFSGMVRKGILYLDHHLMMGHFAARAIPDPLFHLRDNGGADFNLGVNLSERLFLDSLSVSIGGLLSLDRIRGVDDGWQTPFGATAKFSALYKNLGMSGLFYGGEGHTFLYGDPFYRLKQYGRLDIFFMPFSNSNVKLKIDLGLHFAAGQLDFSQQILVSMTIDESR